MGTASGFLAEGRYRGSAARIMRMFTSASRED
jgi:hypothetical protein